MTLLLKVKKIQFAARKIFRERVAMACFIALRLINNQKRTYRFPIRQTLRNTYAFYGAYSAFSNWEEQLGQIEQSIGQADYSIEGALVFLAAGGPEWDENFTSIDDLEYFLDGTASNVENGLGYVVGIDGRWFRQSTCVTADSSAYAPCTPQDGPYW
ncbi:MAG: hypothetical protein U5K72_13290 [Balneolaceae bacterium]|nr:hypothetical protein [Balneolaceae bacterium]